MRQLVEMTNPLPPPLQKASNLYNPHLVAHDKENLLSRLDARNRAMLGIVQFQSYNLVTNNCEHFANWCKTGKHKSKQMYKAIGTMAWLALLLIIKRPNALMDKMIKDYLF